MKEVMSYILRARLSPISWLNISRETSLASPHTARSYVETLERLFVVKVLNIIQPDGRIMYRRNKKIHLTDPFLYHILSYFTGESVLEENIVESTVVSHLSRVTDVYFWKNKTEVDIVVKLGTQPTGIEIKWGVKPLRKPKHLHVFLLNKEILPVFLASVEWSSN